MSINLQTGGGYTVPVPVPQPQPLPGANSTDIQVIQKQSESYPEKPLPVPGDSTDTIPVSPQQKRYDQVAAVAQRVVSDPYPVSDKSFTIFKDASGQYITRYTSLRDGRVTYVPEERALQQFESQQQTLRSAIQLKV